VAIEHNRGVLLLEVWSQAVTAFYLAADSWSWRLKVRDAHPGIDNLLSVCSNLSLFTANAKNAEAAQSSLVGSPRSLCVRCVSAMSLFVCKAKVEAATDDLRN
jgi:hypothetical protein